MADPNELDYFRRGRPFGTLKGAADALGFDHFRRGRPVLKIKVKQP